MLTIAGIDADSNGVHIVRLNLDDDQAVYNRIRVDNVKGDYHERARRLRDQLPSRGAWADHGVVQFVIEDPRTPPKIGVAGAVPQAVLRGALLACLPVDVPILFLPPHEWKRWSLGNGSPGRGHAKKPEISEWVDRHWRNQPQHMTQDAADAYAIAWAGRRLLDHHAQKGAAA